MSHQGPDLGFKKRVEQSFLQQGFMGFIGAELTEVNPGYCEIKLPYKEELSQHHGFFHAGVIGTLADNAGGFAALTLMPPGSSVLTVEYKLNLLAPGDGELLIAKGYVIKPGRTLTICRSEVQVLKRGAKTLCAVGLMTLIALPGKS